MKDSEIYHRAAELIDSNQIEFSCIAIKRAVNYSGNYVTLPIARDYCGFMDTSQAAIEHSQSEGFDVRELRVWLLLLASAIAESEGR